MLVDTHGQPLNTKLRQEAAKPQLGWIVCKIIDNGVYQPVVDGRTKALAIAPSAKEADDLANLLCQRELQPQPGAMVKPGQESSAYAVLKLTGESIVQVKVADESQLLNGGKSG
jgi:hypothetical protein